MTKIATALVCAMSAFAALAQSTNPNEAPPLESINVPAIIVFMVIFFGLCGYYGWTVYRKEKQRQQEKRDTNGGSGSPSKS